MTMLIINNYFENDDLPKIYRIVDVLRNIGKDSLILHFSEIEDKKIDNNFEALILSGSPASLVDPGDLVKFEAEIELIKKVDIPILGICFGHQLVGAAFGSKPCSLDHYVKGFKTIEILADDRIFSPHQAGGKLVVMQNHVECVDQVPADFIHLAISQTCRIEAMRHRNRPIYGFQPHIERFSDEHMEGFQIIRNFVENIVCTAPR